jgi:tRNA1(Val) A37 N6-methylase TrmN6
LKATELTLKQELAPILGEELHIDYTTETSIIAERRSQVDITYAINDLRIVLELEIGSHRKLLEGIGQADGYREALQASGTITIVYPEEARTEVESRGDVKQLLTNLSFEALVLTPFQRKYYPQVSLQSFVESLRAAINRPQPTDLDTLLSALRECVENIAFLIKRSRSTQSAVAGEVISQLELFSALAGPEEDVKPETLESAAADLASYIIVNQLLLYFLLSPTLHLPKLGQISSPQELESSFKLVTNVDYRAVYRINVLQRLPKQCLGALNRLITAFRNLKPEALSHDLLGRMFHEFLPLATRKLFATFYTKPAAAEILASLATDHSPTNVLEPATGSGTILVSIYQVLRRTMPNLNHNEILARLYAIDIMPFAAHLAALNLTLQDLTSKTENVNVGIGNSLNIRPSAKYPTQIGLFDRNITKRANAQQHFDEELSLPKQFDLIIMNPPFTDSRRYVAGMLGSREKAFSEIQNYWAYFLSLADDMLRPGGRIAAVLPRLFISGSKSREVREWLFSRRNYSMIWVVRTTKEFAFSEAASFRDFLVVLEKSKEQDRLPHCRIVYLNRGLNDFPLNEISSLVQDMKDTSVGRSVLRTSDFCIFEVSQQMIQRNRDDLWSFVGFEYPENSFAVAEFFDRLRQYSGSKLTSLHKYLKVKNLKDGLGKDIPRGFEPKPKGLYSAIYITRLRKKRPDEPNALHLVKDEASSLLADCTGQRLRIPKQNAFPAIYSGSYLRTFFIDSTNCDYVVSSMGDFSKNLQNFSGIPINYNYVAKSIDKCQTHILVAKRLNIVAPGTTHLAFYSEHKMVSPNTFYSIRCNPKQALMLATWINSIFGVLQLLQIRKETEGGYCDLLKEDLASFLVPHISSPPEEISRWFEKYRFRSFPSLLLQFKENSVRSELDKAWMRWLGWPSKTLEKDLHAIYSAISNELQAISLAGKKKKADPSQTKLNFE